MAVSKAGVIAAAVMFVVVVSLRVEVEGTITCGQVTSSLGQCIGYLKGSPGPPAACCGGVKKLNSLAKTTQERQQACTCLKTIAQGLKGLNYGVAAGLPGKCGVNIPYKISPSTDCSTVK